MKVLMLVCHRDDEILSAGGLLAQLDPKKLFLFYFNSVHPDVPQQEYDAEANAVQSALGCLVSYSAYQKVNHLEDFPVSSHVAEIENVLNSFEPDLLLLPHPSYNADHRRIFEAGITASRVHDRNFFVKNVLTCEQPETIQTQRLGQSFVPHIYVPIDIGKKLELYHLYKSQQREHRSDHYIRSLAGMRGAQYNVPYAEAYMVVRGGLNVLGTR